MIQHLRFKDDFNSPLLSLTHWHDLNPGLLVDSALEFEILADGTGVDSREEQNGHIICINGDGGPGTPFQTPPGGDESDGRFLFDLELIAEGHHQVAYTAFRLLAAGHTCNGKTATIVGTTSADNIIGTSGNDVIQARAGDDYVRGGDDDLCGGPGNDTVIGDSGRDKVTGGDGNDFVRGGAGNDTVDGNTGTNTVWGDSGTDWCFNGSSYAACELPLCDHQPELCICDDTCF